MLMDGTSERRAPLAEIVKADLIVPPPTPLQIVRHPTIPRVGRIVNVTASCTFCGPNGENLNLNLRNIAEAARLTLGITYKRKMHALKVSLALTEPHCNPTLTIYQTAGTLHRADKTPEHVVLTAQTMAAELSRVCKTHIAVKNIGIRNIVTVFNAGRPLDLVALRRIVGEARCSSAVRQTQTTVRKTFKGLPVKSARIPKVTYLFWVTGSINCGGARVASVLETAIEEIDDILRQMFALTTRGDRNNNSVSSTVIRQRETLARANAMVRRAIPRKTVVPEGIGIRFCRAGSNHTTRPVVRVQLSVFHGVCVCCLVLLLTGNAGCFALCSRGAEGEQYQDCAIKVRDREAG